MSENLKATAYHEAGHVVADVRYEFQSDGASIIPGKHWLGYASSGEGGEEYDPNTRMLDKTSAEYSVVAFLAGYAAEVEYDPASKSRAEIGAANDFARAADILSKLGPGQVFKIWQRKARDFVKDNWKAIEIVARELLEVKTLNGDEVALIVEISDGKKGAAESLASHRKAIGRPPTQQFPYKVRKEL